MIPADGSIRTRTEAVAHAIEAARVAIEQHLQSAGDLDVSAPLISAHRSLLRAAHLLERKPKGHARAVSPDRLSQTRADTGPDDLTRVRGIDSKAVVRLNALGITRFAQIAAWEPEDVRSIGLALDLGRSFQSNGVIDQAKMLIAPLELIDAPSADTVAGWSPRASQSSAVLDEMKASPLTAAQMEGIHATLRAGPGKAQLQCIAKMAPLVARRVYIPLEIIDDLDEAPWRPSPLMETAEPSVQIAPVTETPVVDAALEPVPELAPALAVVAISEAEVEPNTDTGIEPIEPARAVETPLHIVTLDRIAALDAEITALSAPAVPLAAPVPSAEAKPVVAPAAPETKPMAPSPPVPRLPARAVSMEEADIEIKVRPGRAASLLQPMSELPLRPKRKVMLAEATPDAPTEVSEAAVVIVKRRASHRAAPDLEFYKPNASGDDTGAHVPARKSSRVEGELAS